MDSKHSEYKLSAEEQEKRKNYFMATLVTCAAIAMIGGVVHVVQLGNIRISDMRDKASYDIKEMRNHIRAAGEDYHRKVKHRTQDIVSYQMSEVDTLLAPEQWQEINSQVLIPAGKFIMGTNSKYANLENQPQHEVTLKAYKIDKYPVTNAQYARFVAATGHRPPLHWKDGKIPKGLEMHPVVMVSWKNAKAYAEWAGKRLPTEAEWEKAARGTKGYRWPWGNQIDPRRMNNYESVNRTTDVTAYPNGASPYGVMDMAGNVLEWVNDDFLPYEGSQAPASVFRAKVYRKGTASEQAMKLVDIVETDARYKVLRGGSWKGDPLSSSSYHRNSNWPDKASDFYGFRCAQDVATGTTKVSQNEEN